MQTRGRRTRTRGLTIVEMMVSLLLSSIMILTVGAVLFHGQRGWAEMYRRATSPVVADAYAARAAFEANVRKSTYRTCAVGVDGATLEVYYYNDNASASIDRYTTFYVSGGRLEAAYGPLEPGTFTPLTPTATAVLARNVTSCVFSVNNECSSMHLVLDNGRESMTVDATALRHNK